MYVFAFVCVYDVYVCSHTNTDTNTSNKKVDTNVDKPSRVPKLGCCSTGTLHPQVAHASSQQRQPGQAALHIIASAKHAGRSDNSKTQYGSQSAGAFEGT